MGFNNKTKAFWTKHKKTIVLVGSGAALGAICLGLNKTYANKYLEGLRDGASLASGLMVEHLKRRYPDNAEEMWNEFVEMTPNICDDIFG